MRLFISYRRADTQTVARSMKTFLDQIPRIDEVFLDFDEIGIGEDFEAAIRSSLAKSSHCLVLIGKDYLGASTGPQGDTRIFDPQDFVRREAVLALESDARVIPVLVDGAPMPSADGLPEELKHLPKLNAFQLRTSHFNADMDDLLDVVFGQKKGRGSRWRRPKLTFAGALLRASLGFVAGLGLLIALGILSDIMARAGGGGCGSLACRMQQVFGFEHQEDALGAVMLFAAMVLGLGAFLPFLPRILRK
ncbi:MAG: TIR domain-containing protein [Alphaproteobacteria bacterium]|jgi:hypothetical protein|nr:TIR domain-containing protein [Alphaproteobacteria bacterium]